MAQLPGGVRRALPGVRRVLAVSVVFGGLLLGTAASCDTGSAPSAPPVTVAPTPDDSDDGQGRGRGGDEQEDQDDSGGSGGDGDESEGRDDGGLSGRGNDGESR